jgi:serine phosphatase RsbU (regulator of sigma subunit)
VKARTKEVVEQKDHIEHILQDIQASINYAQRIQQALLPSRDSLKEYLPKHFIIFHPRDVVSGDFYWATKIDKWVVVTVADSTGHGVPGAFMSMLGISFLNEIVRKKEVVSASMILDSLREAVIEALKQTGKQNEQKDGMDMSIAAINIDTNICLWAGANNPLYIVRNGEPLKDVFDDECGKCKILTFETNHLIEVKGDKMPVAIHTVMDKYKNYEIQLLKGDRIFLITDGFSDQFGGPDYRKFMAKNFKELIAKSASLPIIQQGLEIDKAFKLWKNYKENDYEQIDDVTVMGIEV